MSLFHSAGRLKHIAAFVIAVFFELGNEFSHIFIDVGRIAIQQQKAFRHIIIPRPSKLRISHIVVIKPKLLGINNVMLSESGCYPMPIIALQGSV